MVNNVNGTNPNLYVDTRNNNGQQKFVAPPTQQGGYKNDGYAFNMSNTVTNGPVPDVKVGFMDKMGLTFKDVMPTDENTKRFVAFEQGMKSNPQGYLKPGENDVTATTDLQKKLKVVGYNVTVNGQFGNSTEQAVIRFKNSVGINDGYLTKNGKYAVSGIVTPQTWAVLNSGIAARLNPNSNLSGGSYVPPVTASELSWAKDLQGKISTYGYRPSSEEKTKYESIYQRQRVGMQSQGGVFDPTKASPPTEQELAWAQDIANKMKQFGYKPSQAERGKYQEIYQRIDMNKAGNVSTPKPVQQKTQIGQADVDWAVNLMNKVKGGYKPTSAEAQKYQKVYDAMQSGQVPQKKNTESVSTTGNTAPKQNTGKPSSQELTWASQLESKVAQGYNPTAVEKNKYTDIFDRYSASKSGNTGATSTTAPKQNTGKPSNTEIQWAADLEAKTNSGAYQPSQAEIDKYTDIANRLKTSQKTQQPKTETTAKPNLTVNITDKSDDPYHGRTVEKFGKIGNAFDQWSKKHSGTAFPRDNVFYANSDGKLISQSAVNSAAKSGGSYISQLGLKNAPALYIPGFSVQKAQDYSYVNGKVYSNSILDKGANLKVTSAETPVTPKKTAPKQNLAPVQTQDNPEPTAQTQQNQAPTNTGSNQTVQNGVTREELDWAENFQAKTTQGYKPTEQELAVYTDIYNRFQSGTAPKQPDYQYQPQQQNNAPVQNTSAAQTQQTQNVSVDLSNGDPQLAWALNLLDKVQQGYNPSQDEITKYEQTIAKNQSVQANP